MTAASTPSSHLAPPPPAAGAMGTSHTTNRFLPWIVGVFVILPFLGWWSYGLFDLDEGFYAAIVREMLRRHEWVTPFYNGAPWYEKPILIYWTTRPFLSLFGSEAGPRLPSVLATLATIGLVAWFARRRLAAGTRYVAPLVLASSLLVVAIGRMLLTDPLLVLFLSAALLWFWESLVGDTRWRVASGAALGVAVLAKGPVSVALFVAVAGLTWWREPALRPRFRGWWGTGALLCAVVVSLWYVPIYLARGDEFVQGFIVEQNINRFLGGDVSHAVPGLANLVAYVPVLLLGMLPWSLFLWRAWPRRGDPEDSAPAVRRFLATWGATVFVFFTLAGSKLPHYLLPAMVPFGLLVADDCARRWAPVTVRRLLRPLVWTAAVAIFAQAAFLAYYYGVTVQGRVVVPGLQAEVHQIASHVRATAAGQDAVVEYRTGRLRGVKSPHLVNETTHPSLRFYLDRVVPVVDDFATVLADPRIVWLITRRDRVGVGEEAAAARAGRRIERVTTPFPQVYYALFRIDAQGTR